MISYRVSRLTEDVVALVEATEPRGGKVHVVGHDWAAAVVWTPAAARPDVVATLTALSVPHPAAFVRAVFTSRQFLMSWYMFAVQPPLIPEMLIRRLDPSAAPRHRAHGGRAGSEHTRGFVSGPYISHT
ncbi:hypothetical protein [Streptomyces sp. NPDC017524]|uniref:hypothetical protein n=1 Tax=Streptomyces sp. NPDC017524 TaxID=3364999 RepID=UPI0037A5C084